MNHAAFDRIVKSFPAKQATIEQIEILRKELSIELCTQYIDFFLNYSGAIFRHYQYIKDEGDFYSFYTIDELKFEYQFLRFSVEREMKIDCYEGHLLPIASTCFYSSYICFPTSSMSVKVFG